MEGEIDAPDAQGLLQTIDGVMVVLESRVVGRCLELLLTTRVVRVGWPGLLGRWRRFVGIESMATCHRRGGIGFVVPQIG